MGDVNVNCTSIQATVGAFSVRAGKCEDDAGNQYLDLGAGVGPGAGIYYLESRESRDSIDIEARGDIGFFAAGQASTLGNGGGWGFGIGANVGVRGLIPLGNAGVKTRPSR